MAELIRLASDKPFVRTYKRNGKEVTQYILKYRLLGDKHDKQITSTESADECYKKYLALSADILKKGKILKKENILLTELVKEYLDTHLEYLTMRSRNNLAIASREFKRIDKSIKDLTNLDIEYLFKQLRIENKSDSYISKVTQLLNNVLNRAVQLDIVHRNELQYARIPKTHKPKEKVEALTLSERRLFLRESEREHFRNLFIFAIESAARASEILALTYSDVNYKEKTAVINNQIKYEKLDEEYDARMLGTEKLIRIIEPDQIEIDDADKEEYKAFKLYKPKSAKGTRTIILTDAAIEALKAQREYNETNVKENPEQLFFCTESGKYSWTSNLNRALRRIKQRMGIKKLSMHIFRHTGATKFFEMGFNVQEVAAQMGDSNISVVIEIYNSIQEEHLLKKKDEMLEVLNKDAKEQAEEMQREKEEELKNRLDKLKKIESNTKKVQKKTKKTAIK